MNLLGGLAFAGMGVAGVLTAKAYYDNIIQPNDYIAAATAVNENSASSLAIQTKQSIVDEASLGLVLGAGATAVLGVAGLTTSIIANRTVPIGSSRRKSPSHSGPAFLSRVFPNATR